MHIIQNVWNVTYVCIKVVTPFDQLDYLLSSHKFAYYIFLLKYCIITIVYNLVTVSTIVVEYITLLAIIFLFVLKPSCYNEPYCRVTLT